MSDTDSESFDTKAEMSDTDSESFDTEASDALWNRNVTPDYSVYLQGYPVKNEERCVSELMYMMDHNLGPFREDLAALNSVWGFDPDPDVRKLAQNPYHVKNAMRNLIRDGINYRNSQEKMNTRKKVQRRARFSVRYVENDTTFTIVAASTNAKLYHDVLELRTFKRIGLDAGAQKTMESSCIREFICNRALTAEEKATVEEKHPRTTVTFTEVVPPRVTRIDGVAFAHKNFMREYAFLRKDAPAAVGEKSRWYYLVPYEVDEAEIAALLKDSIRTNRLIRK